MYLPMQIEPIAFKLQSLPTTSVVYKPRTLTVCNERLILPYKQVMLQ